MDLNDIVSNEQKKAEVDEFFEKIAAEYAVGDFMKGAKQPRPQIRFAYAMILSEVFPSYSLKHIGSLVGKDHSTIIYYKKQVEDAVYLVEDKHTIDKISNTIYNIYASAKTKFEHYIADAKDALRHRESFIGVCNKIKHYENIKESYLKQHNFCINDGGKSNREKEIYLYDRYGNLIFTFASIKEAAKLLNTSEHYIHSYLDKDLLSHNHGYLRSEKKNKQKHQQLN